MSDPSDDTGTIQALLDRLVKFRLPRALELRERVEGGGRLEDADVAFLKNALADAQSASPIMARHPELHAVSAQIVQLYDAIVRKALENEKGA